MTHKYRQVIENMVKCGELADLGPGDVGHVHVYHDGWCAIWTGGDCNCEPIAKRGKVTQAPPRLAKPEAKPPWWAK